MYRERFQRKTSFGPYLELPSDEINTGILVLELLGVGKNREKLLVQFASLEM